MAPRFNLKTLWFTTSLIAVGTMWSVSGWRVWQRRHRPWQPSQRPPVAIVIETLTNPNIQHSYDGPGIFSRTETLAEDVLPTDDLPLQGLLMSEPEILSHVRHLTLRQTSIDEKTLQGISNLKQLEQLTLFHCHLIVSSLKPLARAPNLRRLAVYDTLLSEQHLAAIADFSALRDLVLPGRAVTVDSLAELSTLIQLEHLTLTDDPVADSLLDRLRVALPGCLLSVNSPPQEQ